MGRFNPRELLVIDTETTGLRHWTGDRPFAVPLCDENGNTYYTEWPVNPLTRQVTPDPGDVRYLRNLFGNPKLRKVLFNAKFDYFMLKSIGIPLAGPLEDVGVAARICYTLEYDYSLKALSDKYDICDNSDETALKLRVNSCRRIAKAKGWKIHEEPEADYWLPRALDKDDSHCEEYALKDVYPRTLMLWLMYTELAMPEDPALRRTYEFEMREFWPEIIRMEERGVRIHLDINERKLQAAKEKRERLEKSLQQRLIVAGKKWADNKVLKNGTVKPLPPFNPGSPKQLARVLYDPRDGFGLDIHKYSDAGQPSTDWKALREHLTHPFVQELVQFRSADKEEGTYFGAYKRLAVPCHIQTGAHCIHTSFNQLGAAKTSRTSSNDPNLQNVGDANNNPNSPAPLQARDPFGPRDGFNWYSLDWSGQEMRIFADVAQIDTMLEAFYSGKSVHDHNANLAWGGKGNPHALTAASYSLELGSANISKPEVLAVWRELGWNPKKALIHGFDGAEAKRAADMWLSKYDYNIIKAESAIGIKRAKTRAKNLGFADIYGAGVGGVIDMLYCSREEARQMLDRFDEIHPAKRPFMDRFSAEAAINGYIYNMFGRRLNVEASHAYKAVNYLVQGTAAEMMKRAAIACAKYLRETGLDAHLIMLIHDELVFEIRRSHAYKWLLRGLRNIMENVRPPGLKIPMPVECSRIRQYWHMKEEVKL